MDYREQIAEIRRQLRETPPRQPDQPSGAGTPPTPPPVPAPLRFTDTMVTGHRADRMGDEGWLREQAALVLDRLGPRIRLLSGMAWGTDLVMVELALERGLPVLAVVPYPQQPARWTKEWQGRYEAALSQVSEKIVLDQEYLPSSYARRNQWLVNHSAEAVVVWDGRPEGGTWQTIRMLDRESRSWVWIDPERRRVVRRSPSPLTPG